MEAVWSLEDKWKLSTHKVIALFTCTSVLAVGLCFAGAMLRWRKSRTTRSSGTTMHQETSNGTPSVAGWLELPGHPVRCSVVMSALIGSVRWSPRSKWDTGLRGSQREGPTPLLVKVEDNVGWQSHNSASAVWQRPILMGEKCELPRFSGLILYDQRGRPLHHCEIEQGITYEEVSD